MWVKQDAFFVHREPFPFSAFVLIVQMEPSVVVELPLVSLVLVVTKQIRYKVYVTLAFLEHSQQGKEEIAKAVLPIHIQMMQHVSVIYADPVMLLIEQQTRVTNAQQEPFQQMEYVKIAHMDHSHQYQVQQCVKLAVVVSR
jgi:hypothetical protein